MKKYLFIPVLMSALFNIALSAESTDADKIAEGKAATCAACHGPAGVGVNPEWPKLAGQHARYVKKQLLEFKASKRHDPVMAGQATILSDEDIELLAQYFAKQPHAYDAAVITADSEQSAELLKLGEQLYRGGDLARNIAACTACHGPTGSGVKQAGYPSLAGQYAPYVAKQLKAFRTNLSAQATTTDPASLVYRDNDPSKMMRDTAAQLTDKEIQALSSYIQGLQP